jgi:cyclic pyranopterin phosphate synthase
MDEQTKQLVENGLRIQVTSLCNLNCIFCHNEGQNYRESVRGKSDVINNDIILKFINYGIRVLTFSGGEPLIYYEELKKTLNFLLNIPDFQIVKELDVTVVTNGILLDEDRVRFFKDFSEKAGNFKFNVSLHTSDKYLHEELTKKGQNFDRVMSNLKLLDKYNIDYKINYVLLKTKNSKEELLEDMFRFSVHNNIKNIKIIEMLVTEFNKDFYNEFHEISPLIYNLRHRAKRQIIDSRKALYVLKDMPLNVEILRCTCSLGCRDCLTNREIEISGDTYKPCFLNDKKYKIDDEATIESIYANVKKDIKAMAEKYGNGSPSLTLKQKLIHYRNIYQLNMKEEQFNKLWKEHKIKTYKELEITGYEHPYEKKLNNPYSFYLEIPSESPEHTKIISSKKTINNFRGKKYLKEEYLDKIYHFAMSRRDVCEKKLSAMLYLPLESNKINLDIINLHKYEEQPDDLILLKKVRINKDKLYFILEITSGNSTAVLKNILEEYNMELDDYNIEGYVPAGNLH